MKTVVALVKMNKINLKIKHTGKNLLCIWEHAFVAAKALRLKYQIDNSSIRYSYNLVNK